MTFALLCSNEGLVEVVDDVRTPVHQSAHCRHVRRKNTRDQQTQQSNLCIGTQHERPNLTCVEPFPECTVQPQSLPKNRNGTTLMINVNSALKS